MNRYALPLMVSLSLGLAPFFPEPHLVGKLRWVAGGATGMGPMDWFDLAMHGSPWVVLAIVAAHHAWTTFAGGQTPETDPPQP